MKSFLSLKPKIWQSVYAAYNKENPDKSKEDIQSILEQSVGLDSELSSSISPIIYNLIQRHFYDNDNDYISDDDRAFIYASDVKKIKTRLSSESDIKIKRLLLAFIIYLRCNPHPSGWIRYDKEQIFYIAGLSKLSIREGEILTCKLHSQYGLNMQVVGSTQPIPCFHFDWLDNTLIKDDKDDINEKDENHSDFIIDIGPFSPSSIIKFIEELNK